MTAVGKNIYNVEKRERGGNIIFMKIINMKNKDLKDGGVEKNINYY